jgi:D-alanyl-D-alanine dipeptidase
MNDDAQRRRFWAQQMDAAYDFMSKVLDYPVQECGEPLVSIPDAVRAAGVEVTFANSKLAIHHDRIFRLRERLIPSLVAVAREMNSQGWILRIEDGYRSRDMQRALFMQPAIFDEILKKVLWELDGEMPSPEFLFRRITVLTATRPKIGTHMSGSAVDISVWHAGHRREVDRGGPYIDLSERTPMNSPFIPAEAGRNRAAITRIMETHGFLAYPYEFWHYSQGDVYAEILTKSGRPGRYGAVDWNPTNEAITPVPHPRDPLASDNEIRLNIEAACKRIRRDTASGQEDLR